MRAADELSDYALARCLAYAYAGEPFGQDAERAARVYKELGGFNDSSATALDVLAKHFSARTSDAVQGNLSLMRCADMRASTVLKDLVRKLLTRGHS